MVSVQTGYRRVRNVANSGFRGCGVNSRAKQASLVVLSLRQRPLRPCHRGMGSGGCGILLEELTGRGILEQCAFFFVAKNAYQQRAKSAHGEGEGRKLGFSLMGEDLVAPRAPIAPSTMCSATTPTHPATTCRAASRPKLISRRRWS